VFSPRDYITKNDATKEGISTLEPSSKVSLKLYISRHWQRWPPLAIGVGKDSLGQGGGAKTLATIDLADNCRQGINVFRVGFVSHFN
jgi:hypothetical protein